MNAPRIAPIICIAMNGSALAGLIPVNVSVSVRPIVTAGLAKDVEELKKYAAPIQAGTRIINASERSLRTAVTMMNRSPAVAST